ncbi:MAG: GNAT family N-acetyltransferase [Nocardioidaceae bacterium]
MNSVQVRSYEPGDREQVLALAPRLIDGVAAWRDPAGVASAVTGWVTASLAAAEADERPVWVALRHGRVIGFVTAERQRHWSGADDAYIGELAVAHHAGGGGVGRALVEAVVGWAHTQRLDRVTLSTGAANLAARRFYAALGFAEEDVRLTLVLDAKP